MNSVSTIKAAFPNVSERRPDLAKTDREHRRESLATVAKVVVPNLCAGAMGVVAHDVVKSALPVGQKLIDGASLGAPEVLLAGAATAIAGGTLWVAFKLFESARVASNALRSKMPDFPADARFEAVRKRVEDSVWWQNWSVDMLQKCSLVVVPAATFMASAPNIYALGALTVSTVLTLQHGVQLTLGDSRAKITARDQLEQIYTGESATAAAHRDVR